MLESGRHGPGELFSKIILEQFLRIRDGDRFWYENFKQTRYMLSLVSSTMYICSANSSEHLLLTQCIHGTLVYLLINHSAFTRDRQHNNVRCSHVKSTSTALWRKSLICFGHFDFLPQRMLTEQGRMNSVRKAVKILNVIAHWKSPEDWFYLNIAL